VVALLRGGGGDSERFWRRGLGDVLGDGVKLFSNRKAMMWNFKTAGFHAFNRCGEHAALLFTGLWVRAMRVQSSSSPANRFHRAFYRWSRPHNILRRSCFL